MATNRVIVASAGSRKTTFLVEEALRQPEKSTLITTYTIENIRQIIDFVTERIGCVPKNLQILTWYSFLLRECVRPYQNFLYDKKRISNISFMEGRSALYVRKENVSRYYFQNGEWIYTDKIAEFACVCNELSQGLVIARLEQIYDQIFVDESQDLAGYDFDLLELLVRSILNIVIVGDCRQSTYFTNCSPKNHKFKGYNIIRLFNHWESKGLCVVTQNNESFRCNQKICDFADRLYPELDATKSKNGDVTGHDGVFVVNSTDVSSYYDLFKTVVLKDSIKTLTMDLPSMNFGIAKGKTFDRVLIFPNGPIRKYLASGDSSQLAPRTKAGLYVAITRAKYSVAFVCQEIAPDLDIEGFVL
ncbi:MAG TPA: UvrD-helicase domain-containing protein [Bacteroidota bacterium]|nr:UvrD-helicase domain-containing protein [Bacteroidota bacterium]